MYLHYSAGYVLGSDDPIGTLAREQGERHHPKTDQPLST